MWLLWTNYVYQSSVFVVVLNRFFSTRKYHRIDNYKYKVNENNILDIIQMISKLIAMAKSKHMQIQNPAKHLRRSFFAKIVTSCYLFQWM